MMRPDILIRSEDDEPIAVVEIKNRRNMTPLIAQQIRRNLLVHGLSRPTRYFLLLTQDKGYVWMKPASSSFDAPPDREFSMSEVVDRYLPLDDPDRRFRERELSLIVLRWLDDLASGHANTSREPERVLSDVGFLDAIDAGTLLTESVS